MSSIALSQAINPPMTISAIAHQLAAHGRGNDTLLAHISPREALILKRLGGSGARNPTTGLLEFDDSGDYSFNPDYSLSSGNSSLGLQPTPSPDTTSSSNYSVTPNYSFTGSSGGGNGDGTGLRAPAGGVFNSPSLQTPQLPSFSQGASNVFAGGGGPSFTPSSNTFTPDYSLNPPAGAPNNVGGAAGLNFAASNAPGLTIPTGAVAGPGLTSAGFGTQAQSPDQAITGQSSNTPPPAKTPQPSFLDKLGTGLEGALTSPATLSKLLAGGVGGLAAGTLANRASNNASAQAQEYRGQYNNLASPLRTQGQNLIAMGQSGQLLPSQQQALQAQRARMQQQMANSGVTSGTAQQQMEAAIQNQAQQYSQNLINQGVQMLGLGDQYAAQGIQTEYQANNEANQLASEFAAQLGQVLSGVFK